MKKIDPILFKVPERICETYLQLSIRLSLSRTYLFYLCAKLSPFPVVLLRRSTSLMCFRTFYSTIQYLHECSFYRYMETFTLCTVWNTEILWSWWKIMHIILQLVQARISKLFSLVKLPFIRKLLTEIFFE